MSRKKKINIYHLAKRLAITISMLVAIMITIKVAPNYSKDATVAKSNTLIINNNNITKMLKSDIIMQEDKTIYMSLDDVRTFFDETITVERNKIITTSNTKTIAIPLDNNRVYENGSYWTIEHNILQNDGRYYLPMSDLQSVYNYEMKYNEKNKIITIDSLNRKAVEAVAKKNLKVKLKASKFSRSVDEIKRGDSIIIVQDTEKNDDAKVNGWIKIRTANGILGYIKESKIINKTTIRENLENAKIEGKVSMMWDYYNQYTAAPNRTSKVEGINVVSPSFYELKSDGSLAVNVGNGGKNYINWAKENNYEIWPTLSNSMLNNLDAVSRILSSFETRSNLIDNIIGELIKLDVNGISIDFENMYKSDKDNYSRFLIELNPRLKEVGLKLCVILTEPDGSDTWSLCYDRNTIGKTADYVVFMAFEQSSPSLKKAGTLSGADWIELNIKKFLGQEGIPKEKIILSMPFYTRLWREDGSGIVTSKVVNMKDIKIPNGVQAKWDERLKQNYIEYSDGGAGKYKMWIEDVKSISAKLDLVNHYELAGAGFWEKDRETEDVWEVIKEKLK